VGDGDSLEVQDDFFDDLTHFFDKKKEQDEELQSKDEKNEKDESLFDMIKHFFDDDDEEEESDIAEIAKNHPNVHKTIREIVEDAGFNFENHTVVTDDGYVLEMHRLYTNIT
jgi:hypothetical protein